MIRCGCSAVRAVLGEELGVDLVRAPLHLAGRREGADMAQAHGSCRISIAVQMAIEPVIEIGAAVHATLRSAASSRPTESPAFAHSKHLAALAKG